MWQVLGWAAWVVSAALILWMVWDFFIINKNYGESVLLSSREGVDQLFADTNKSKGS